MHCATKGVEGFRTALCKSQMFILGLDSAVGIFILVLQSAGVSTLWIFNNSSVWIPSLRIDSPVCRSVVIVKDPSYSYFTK